SVFPRLIAYLPFDQIIGATAYDATSNGWNGTLVNGAGWVSGKSGNAVNLNGSSQYISLPTNITATLSDFTIATWVYLNSLSTWMRIFDFGVAANTPTRYMFLSPKSSTGVVRFAITVGTGGGEQRIDGTAALPTGAWHHIAVTLSGSVGVLYVDGVPV